MAADPCDLPGSFQLKKFMRLRFPAKRPIPGPLSEFPFGGRWEGVGPSPGLQRFYTGISADQMPAPATPPDRPAGGGARPPSAG